MADHTRDEYEGMEPVPVTRADAGPEDPQEVRAEIEQTRARMSDTIDEIEEVLLRKKERIQDRLDVLAPVRERPLATVGVVFGVGLALGLLTGGDDEEEQRWEGDGRADLWETRARRLLRIAREQEEELDRLRAAEAVGVGAGAVHPRAFVIDDAASERVSGFVREGMQRFFRGVGGTA